MPPSVSPYSSADTKRAEGQRRADPSDVEKPKGQKRADPVEVKEKKTLYDMYVEEVREAQKESLDFPHGSILFVYMNKKLGN